MKYAEFRGGAAPPWLSQPISLRNPRERRARLWRPTRERWKASGGETRLLLNRTTEDVDDCRVARWWQTDGALAPTDRPASGSSAADQQAATNRLLTLHSNTLRRRPYVCIYIRAYMYIYMYYIYRGILQHLSWVESFYLVFIDKKNLSLINLWPPPCFQPMGKLLWMLGEYCGETVCFCVTQRSSHSLVATSDPNQQPQRGSRPSTILMVNPSLICCW